MNIRGVILLPFSILYGLVTFFRNILFDIGIFREKKHDVCVISVGNLSMGGTGKTPHVEYLVSLLSKKYKVAILSRGYGRKTRGFILADKNADANTIGDEPLQYYHKFEDVLVAVDGRRNRGVKKLLEIEKDLKVIILDDAYQHRWIKPDLSIMLTDFHDMYHNDYIVPSGRLREFRHGSKRADIVVITKTPVVLSPITRRRFIDELKLQPYQKLLFSKIEYDGFVRYEDDQYLNHIPQVSRILMFTGIANSYPLQDYLKRHCQELIVLSFPDHHSFLPKNIHQIKSVYDDIFTSKKMIITTEKDAQRLHVCKNNEELQKLPIYYVPIHVAFHQNDEKELSDTLDNLFREVRVNKKTKNI